MEIDKGFTSRALGAMFGLGVGFLFPLFLFPFMLKRTARTIDNDFFKAIFVVFTLLLGVTVLPFVLLGGSLFGAYLGGLMGLKGFIQGLKVLKQNFALQEEGYLSDDDLGSTPSPDPSYDEAQRLQDDEVIVIDNNNDEIPAICKKINALPPAYPINFLSKNEINQFEMILKNLPREEAKEASKSLAVYKRYIEKSCASSLTKYVDLTDPITIEGNFPQESNGPKTRRTYTYTYSEEHLYGYCSKNKKPTVMQNRDALNSPHIKIYRGFSKKIVSFITYVRNKLTAAPKPVVCQINPVSMHSPRLHKPKAPLQIHIDSDHSSMARKRSLTP